MTQPTRPFPPKGADRRASGKYRLPAIYPEKGFVDDGGLMSYGVDYDDLYRRAAVYVDKILRCQTGRFAGATGDEVRVCDQLEGSETDRTDHSAGSAGAGE